MKKIFTGILSTIFFLLWKRTNACVAKNRIHHFLHRRILIDASSDDCIQLFSLCMDEDVYHVLHRSLFIR